MLTFQLIRYTRSIHKLLLDILIYPVFNQAGKFMAKGYKFERLRAVLADAIEQGNWQAGDRFYSENQLCQKYGVSRQTVRKAFSDLEDKGLLFSKRGSGTYITEKAIENSHPRTHVVGILVTYLSDYIFPIIIKELEQVFSHAGFTVQLASTGNSSMRERELLQKMLNNKVDGIILEPTKSALPSPNMDLYQQLTEVNFPLVSIHASYRDIDIPCVALDDNQAGFVAAKHLLEQKHKKIGAILKSDDLQGHGRYQGILRAHAEWDQTFDDQNVFWYTTEDTDTFIQRAEIIHDRLKDCSAVVCYNDQIAITYQTLLLDSGINIPEGQSIISIDDSRYAPMAQVPLTSVHSPIADIGRTAAEQLLSLIDGQVIQNRTLFQPRLVRRSSVLPLSI